MSDIQQKINVKKIKDKKLKAAINRASGVQRDTVRSQKVHKFFQNDQGGYLEAEENEKTLQFRQKDLEPLISQQNVQNLFELENEFGPYLTNFTQDGKHQLLCGQKGHISLLDFDKKNLLTEFHVNEKINDIAFLNSYQLYAVAQKRHLYIYDDKGMEIHKLKSHLEPLALQYLNYHYLLVTASRLGMIKYLDVSTGQIVSEYKPNIRQISCMKQNNENGMILAGDSQGRVSFFSPNLGSPLVQIQCQKSNVLDVSVNQNYMVTLGAEQTFKIWDIRNSYKPLFEYFSPDSANTMQISQKGLLALGGKHQVNIFKDWKVEKQKRPYMKQDVKSQVQDLEFINYQDYLGICHQTGYQNIIIPGSGEANFDSFEVNLFATKRQRQEKEVKSLLEKLPWQSITMKPEEIGTIDKASKEVIQKEIKEIEQEKERTLIKNKKRKMRGKDKAGKKVLRKERVHDLETRQKLVEFSNNQKLIKKAEKIQKQKNLQLLEQAEEINPEKFLNKKKIHIN